MDLNIPCKPLSDTEDSKAYEDEALDEDSGQCNLVRDQTWKAISNGFMGRNPCNAARLKGNDMYHKK